jgi:hypothetical protein
LGFLPLRPEPFQFSQKLLAIRTGGLGGHGPPMIPYPETLNKYVRAERSPAGLLPLPRIERPGDHVVPAHHWEAMEDLWSEIDACMVQEYDVW